MTSRYTDGTRVLYDISDDSGLLGGSCQWFEVGWGRLCGGGYVIYAVGMMILER